MCIRDRCLRRRAVQRRSQAPGPHRRFTGRDRDREGLLLRAAGLRAVRRQARRGARRAGDRRLRRRHDRLRRALRRGAAVRRGDDLLAERLQVSSSTGSGTSRLLPALGAVLCLAGAVSLHALEDRWAPPQVDRPELLYVRSPAVLKRATLGYEAMAADLYWIRALQHFGAERLSTPPHQPTYSLLYPMLDLTTTLDPYFSIAYR